MKQQNGSINKPTDIKYVLSIILSFFLTSTLYAQQIENLCEERILKAKAKAISIYDKEIGSNSMVNTGSSYYDPHIGIKGHQYFRNDYWEQGSLVYNAHAYDSIFLKYDIYRDLLLIEHFNSDGFLAPIQLYSPKVGSFELVGYSFIWLEKDTISNIKTGFYNQIYKRGDMEVLVKRKKIIARINDIGTIGEEFLERDRYYIKKDSLLHQVKKKSSIIKVFSDQKKEIKSFIRKNNYRFKHDADSQLVEIVKYYDSLF